MPNASHRTSSSGHQHSPSLVPMLDLDAEINAAMLDEILTVVVGLIDHPDEVARILDLGAGTGTGTIPLAQRFPSAEVVAVDIDPRMLALVEERAHANQVQDRVVTLVADASAETLSVGPIDLVWSSLSLHEVGDPDRALHTLFASLRPGGLLAVVEMGEMPRVLPEGLAEFESRVRAAGGASPAMHHPDWADPITSAGFDLVHTGRVTTDQILASNGPAGEYAALELLRTQHRAASALGDADRALLQTLAGQEPGNVRELGELRIRGSRIIWIARRP